MLRCPSVFTAPKILHIVYYTEYIKQSISEGHRAMIYYPTQNYASADCSFLLSVGIMSVVAVA